MRVEYDVPIPPPQKRGKWDWLKDLPVGACVAVDTEKDALKVRDALRFQGHKYTIRKMRDAFRVWKLERNEPKQYIG